MRPAHMMQWATTVAISAPVMSNRGKSRKTQRQIYRCGRDHKPLVILKMAEDGAVAAEHPVVPADILIQAEHQHKAEGGAATAHPSRTP